MDLGSTSAFVTKTTCREGGRKTFVFNPEQAAQHDAVLRLNRGA
jgi:hypothetical protein